MKTLLSLLLFGCVVAAAPVQAAVRYVNAAAVGANNGTSWTDAFTDLQLALAEAQPGDEIWVKAGTYTPGPPGDEVSSFPMGDGVALYGGFAGTETSRSQRDWNAHVTILSGDVGNDDEYGSPTWYIGWNIHSANSDHVLVAGGVGPTAVLDGFTITAGHSAFTAGSGLLVEGGSPTVTNCTFLRNEAGWGAGAGMSVNNGSPAISHCLYTQNWCHICNGAGLYVTGASSPVIEDCTFTENHATADSGSTGQGCAISLWNSAPVTIRRCTFQYNVTSRFSLGSIEYARGAGISAFSSVVDVSDCIFHHNAADFGTGIAAWNEGSVTNCAFWGNTATFSSAGIMCFAATPKTLTVTNCSIAGNTGGEAVAFEAFYSAEIVLQNSIIWDNTATGEEVDPRDRQFNGNATIRYSCVKDLLTAPPGEDPYNPADYPGSFDADPLFVNRPAGDLHLSPDSPCIDAGGNPYVPAGVTMDLDQRARFCDDPAVPDTGTGSPPIVDLGSYESQPPPVIGDLNCDGAVDLLDVPPFVLALTDETAYAAGYPDCDIHLGDLNGDGAEDGLDIAQFVAALVGP